MEKLPRKVVSNACDLCKAGKRKCDGKLPCSYCQKGDKRCAYTQLDKRRRKATMSPSASTSARLAGDPLHASSAEPSSALATSSFNAIAGPSTLSSSSIFGSTQADGPSSASPSFPTPSFFPNPATTSAPPKEGDQDNETLASLARAIGNEGHNNPSPEVAGSSTPIEGIHRHLMTVFSLRSVPASANDEHDDLFERDGDLSSFFLPSQEEGLNFVQCFFEHAASTYRYVEEQEFTVLATRFFAQDPAVLNDAVSSALVLVVMAVGCLWSPSWIGADATVTTPRAIKLYLASKRRVAATSLVPPRLVAVQLHIATTHLFLGLNRYQSAWLSFGTAARISLLLGLHRASPAGTAPEVDSARRKVFHSSFMMDRFLSLIVGLPAFYNESDLTQPYPELDSIVSPQATTTTDSQKILIGSLAHFKLSRIMGHALDSLRSPKDLSPADRSLRIHTIEGELDQWRAETPGFFHPPAAPEMSFADFAHIPPRFERQQWRVRSTYSFIKLLLYRSYLLDELLNRLRRSSSSPPEASVPSTEVQTCVRAAVYIAETASEMQGKSLSGGTFWNTAFFAFSSIAALLVYLVLYPDAADRANVESVIDRAMQANERFSPEMGLTGRQQILQETHRIASLLSRSPPANPVPPAASAAGTSADGANLGLSADGQNNLADFSFPFLFAPEAAGMGTETTAEGWEEMWADLQGLVETGFDTTPRYFPPTF
ncbi:hypothetical protein JCM6882_000902 [Rhodosporidiobolus microsporus]